MKRLSYLNSRLCSKQGLPSLDKPTGSIPERFVSSDNYSMIFTLVGVGRSRLAPIFLLGAMKAVFRHFLKKHDLNK